MLSAGTKPSMSLLLDALLLPTRPVLVPLRLARRALDDLHALASETERALDDRESLIERIERLQDQIDELTSVARGVAVAAPSRSGRSRPR